MKTVLKKDYRDKLLKELIEDKEFTSQLSFSSKEMLMDFYGVGMSKILECETTALIARDRLLTDYEKNSNNNTL